MDAKTIDPTGINESKSRTVGLLSMPTIVRKQPFWLCPVTLHLMESFLLRVCMLIFILLLFTAILYISAVGAAGKKYFELILKTSLLTSLVHLLSAVIITISTVIAVGKKYFDKY